MGLKIDGNNQKQNYSNENKIVEPETKLKINVAAAMKHNGSKPGAGGELGLEKNYNLNEKAYLNTNAEVGIYSNAANLKLGADYLRKNKNFSPVIGLEARYIRADKNDKIYEIDYKGNRANTKVRYSEKQLQLNGKLGLQAGTNNQKFTFTGGLKAGYKAALDKGYEVDTEICDTQIDADGNITKEEYIWTNKHEPASKVNIAAFAETELKVSKHLSLKADGEYGNNYKGGTLGIKYTF